MNREDIDILEVGNAYTALFYKKNHYRICWYEIIWFERLKRRYIK